jgi:hypothetical protein
MLSLLIFALFWSALALISSYGLYRQPKTVVKILAFFQFFQSLCALYLSVLDYVSACWRYYGHVNWNP